MLCGATLVHAQSTAAFTAADELMAARTTPPVTNIGFGAPVGESLLATQRGGADMHVSENDLKATMTDTSARNLSTGSNIINDGSFANSNGLPMVVQNTGNNVIIQNSTILHLNLQ